MVTDGASKRPTLYSRPADALASLTLVTLTCAGVAIFQTGKIRRWRGGSPLPSVPTVAVALAAEGNRDGLVSLPRSSAAGRAPDPRPSRPH